VILQANHSSQSERVLYLQGDVLEDDCTATDKQHETTTWLMEIIFYLSQIIATADAKTSEELTTP
jgi:hypothetical protein